MLSRGFLFFRACHEPLQVIMIQFPMRACPAFLLILSYMLSGHAATAADIDRSVLPIRGPEPPRITEMDARDATKPSPFNVEAPDGAPNVVVVLIDDIGFGATTPFGRSDRGTDVREAREEAVCDSIDSIPPPLCSPTRASLLSGRNHHNVNVGSVMEVATGFPGNLGMRPNDAKYFAETLRHNGYSTAAFGKWHETPTWEVSVSGPYFRWPTHSGFDKFYGFIGGETNQWEPVIFDGVTRVPKKDQEEYHFTTDMTTEAIEWVKFQQAMTPDKAVLHLLRDRVQPTPPTTPRRKWIEKYKGKFDRGWGAARRDPRATEADGDRSRRTRSSPPMPEDIKALGTRSAMTRRQLFALQMETFAGFAEHTDVEVGRLVDADRGDRRTRQHPDHLRHGRQRLERRGRP